MRRLLAFAVFTSLCLALAPAPAAAVPAAVARQPAEKLLPGGNERVLTELDLRKQAADWQDGLQEAGWEQRRLTLPARIPVTGVAVPAMQTFDQQFGALMREGLIPGAAVAVAYKGKLVYARGFGYADVNSHIIMPPDALFRIASISKTFTSVGTLMLCDKGKINLDTQALKQLNLRLSPDLKNPDEHLNQITVKQLLQSTGGWDREISGDPMFVPQVREAAYSYSNTLRPTRDAVLLYGLHKNLDFLPGTHFAYSNFGYAILGRLLENVSGKPYEQYIREDVLKPLGITHAHLGKTMELAAGEVTYYPFPGQETAISVFPNVKGHIALPYGGDFSLEAMQADTGWVASPVDLVRFFSALAGDGPSPRPISDRLFAQMTAKADVPEWKGKKLYFAMGIEVDERNGKDKTEISRQGSLAGGMSYVDHLPNGYTFAFATNTRPMLGMLFQDKAIDLIKKALAKPDLHWSAQDQFELYR